MKNKLIVLLLFLSVGFTQANAQRYVVDLLFANDSINAWEITVSEKTGDEMEGVKAFSIPNGEELTITRVLKGNENTGVIEKDGKEYAVHGASLILSENNPEGTVDLFPDLRKDGKYSASAHFFTTMAPYWIIALLFIAAIAFAFLGRVDSMRGIALIGMPVCIASASFLEIWGFIEIGTNVFWWCDYDTYGFFGSLFRAVPYVLFVAFQIYSIKLYEKILFANEPDKEISIKPMAISIGACIPATIVTAILCAMWWRSATDIASLVVFLTTLIAGIVISYRRNVKALGAFTGTLLTLFMAAYIVGGLIALWGLIVIIFRLIIQILMIIAGIIMIAVVGTRRYKDQYGNKYEEDGFGNIRRIN